MGRGRGEPTGITGGRGEPTATTVGRGRGEPTPQGTTGGRGDTMGWGGRGGLAALHHIYIHIPFLATTKSRTMRTRTDDGDGAGAAGAAGAAGDTAITNMIPGFSSARWSSDNTVFAVSRCPSRKGSSHVVGLQAKGLAKDRDEERVNAEAKGVHEDLTRGIRAGLHLGVQTRGP